MRRTGRMIAVLALLTACNSSGGVTPANEVVNHGIVSGNNQVQPAGTAVAGRTQLLGAVVMQLAQEPKTGRYFLRQLTPDRALDLVVPRAYAEGIGIVVNGSPVPGAIVQAKNLGGLEPFVAYAVTDSQGKALFIFEPSNKVSDPHLAEIKGVVNGVPAVFDTARATIVHGPADPNMPIRNFSNVVSPAILVPDLLVDAYGNSIPYKIDSDAYITAQDTLTGSDGARTVVFSQAGTALRTGIRDSTGKVVAELRYAINGSPLRISYGSVGVVPRP